VLDGAKCLVPWQDGLEEVLVVASEGGAPQAFLVPVKAGGPRGRAREEPRPEGAADRGAHALGRARARAAKLGGEAGADVAGAPEPRTRRPRGGGSRRREGVLRARARLREGASDLRRADRDPAVDRVQARRHGDRDRRRAAPAWEAAWLLDQGRDATREAALAKHQAQRVALEVTDGAIQVYGGHGYTREYLPELHHRNARGFATFEALSLV